MNLVKEIKLMKALTITLAILAFILGIMFLLFMALYLKQYAFETKEVMNKLLIRA
jgi:ABC-type sulfate transport system permease component